MASSVPVSGDDIFNKDELVIVQGEEEDGGEKAVTPPPRITTAAPARNKVEVFIILTIVDSSQTLLECNYFLIL